jgi:hypothetical protein
MDLARAATLVERLLSVGLAIESALTDGRYVVKVTGGKHAAYGVGETFLEALSRASWRWTLN